MNKKLVSLAGITLAALAIEAFARLQSAYGPSELTPMFQVIQKPHFSLSNERGARSLLYRSQAHRLAVIGGSNSAALGLDWDQSWPERLRREFLSPNWHVDNFSVPGINLPAVVSVLEWMEREGFRYNTIVIDYPWGPFPPIQNDPSIFRYSFASGPSLALEKAWRSLRTAVQADPILGRILPRAPVTDKERYAATKDIEYVPAEEKRPAWQIELEEKLLREALEKAKGRADMVVLVAAGINSHPNVPFYTLIPAPGGYLSRGALAGLIAEKNQKAEVMAKQLGVRWVEADALFRSLDLDNFSDIFHLKPGGQRALAERVFLHL